MSEQNLDHAKLAKLESWYQGQVRPFVYRVVRHLVANLDADLARLKAAMPPPNGEFEACFLGCAGIGKSTLINALVAGHEICVPAGGLGTLTAQALTVRYSDNREFRAKYHPPKTIRDQFAGMILQLERLNKQQRESDAQGEPEQESDLPKRARLLVKGDQNGEVDPMYLIDCLRQVIGQNATYGCHISDDDRWRIERLQKLVDLNRDGADYRCGSDDARFDAKLKDHAAGFVSPLIQRLDVRWDSPLLKEGIALIDLPGLGIEGDVYRDITVKHVRERAKAVVLVVGNRGITQSDAELLYSSGFLNRLLHSTDDTAFDPVSLTVAVTKIDDLANNDYMNDRSRKKKDYFTDRRKGATEFVKNGIRERLERAWSLDGKPPVEAKARVIDEVINRMRIFPVSAIEYRKLLAADSEDRSFLSDPEESGVPEMSRGLQKQAIELRNERCLKLVAARSAFLDRLRSVLELIREEWKNSARVREDVDRLRGKLANFIRPLREEFQNRQGAFREFLKVGLPQKIERLVGDAGSSVRPHLQSYLDDLQGAHWRTLQAVVRKGGSHNGKRHVDLPRDFASEIEVPIAESFRGDALKELRERAIGFANDCGHLVNQFVGWVRNEDPMSIELLHAYQKQMLGDVERLKDVGKNVVHHLRLAIKDDLARELEGPIRDECDKFVEARRNEGPGVKDRILSLLYRLSHDAIDKAVEMAQEMLIRHCRATQDDIIKAYFDQYADPLAKIEELIFESQEDRVRRFDPMQREIVLAEVGGLLENWPDEKGDSEMTSSVIGAAV